MLKKMRLPTKAAATYLGDGVSHRTLEGWRFRGVGPRYLRVGGRVLYDVADLDAFLEECRRDPAERFAA